MHNISIAQNNQILWNSPQTPVVVNVIIFHQISQFFKNRTRLEPDTEYELETNTDLEIKKITTTFKRTFLQLLLFTRSGQHITPW